MGDEIITFNKRFNFFENFVNQVPHYAGFYLSYMIKYFANHLLVNMEV